MYIEHPKPKLPAGFQSLPVGPTAVGLTIPTGARHAVVQVRTQPVRYRDDGTNPSSTTGYYLAANAVIELTSREQLAGFKVINGATGVTGSVEINYYKI